ncbi:hypothetical protein NTGBS_70017 [Candidatus Nitrotoga sp. BS]|uniref:hypothetical protein n=1 Tax=Candidatus Nitrotoga sp. BS TaxID=2890408 RepID=UPI001EF2D75C|nr:hypothetical protein [Candidatus Nitrotoga sp. BS]CAH1207477.1 hypothetical protein NTGBS_70017 [Candidatus Nitrotoga sp. BS]
MKTKSNLKHPYCATEHRIIDSPAYADMTFSARSLLVLITRQLTKDNNGHLQATFTYMKQYGFSVNTLSRATHELIAHGFIYKTKSGGFHLGAAQFAVTWLTVKNTHGIFMTGFKSCAWRDWLPSEKKTRPPKVMAYSLKNGELTTPTSPKSEARPYPKSEHNEYVPIDGVFIGVKSVRKKVTSENCAIEYVRTPAPEYEPECFDGEIISREHYASDWDYERGEFIANGGT